MTSLRQLRVSLRQRGVVATAYWAAFGYLRPHRFVIFGTGLDEPWAPGASEAPPGLRLELWSAARLARWRATRRGLAPEFFRDEIDGARRCAVAVDDHDVIGVVWIYEPGAGSRMFRLAAGEAELNYGWVRPADRNHGVFTALLELATSALAAESRLAVYAAVHAANAPSLAAFRAAGFRQLGVVTHVSVFRPRVVWSALGRTPSPRLAHATARAFSLSAILASLADLLG